MYTIQLRNLPENVYNGIKASATLSRRSMTQEAIALIEEALKEKKLDIEHHHKKLEALKKLRELSIKHPLGKVESALEWIKEDRER
jgi:plasmid stability protein